MTCVKCVRQKVNCNLLNGAQMRERSYSGIIISLITKLFINPMNCNYAFPSDSRNTSPIPSPHKLYHHVCEKHQNSICIEWKEKFMKSAF